MIPNGTTAYRTTFPQMLFSRSKYLVDFSAGFLIWENFLVEVWNDNTNDTGDYVQICIDCTPEGGTAPQIDDLRRVL